MRENRRGRSLTGWTGVAGTSGGSGSRTLEHSGRECYERGSPNPRDQTMAVRQAPRDTYRYHFKVGNEIVHRGITRNLDQRANQHRRRWPKGHIVKIGAMVSWESGLAWERAGGPRI